MLDAEESETFLSEQGILPVAWPPQPRPRASAVCLEGTVPGHTSKASRPHEPDASGLLEVSQAAGTGGALSGRHCAKGHRVKALNTSLECLWPGAASF